MKRLGLNTVLILVLALFVGEARPQIKDLLKKIPAKIPGLEDILKSEPAITTGIDDAVTEVPFLDDFDPQDTRFLAVFPRTTDGGFVLNSTGSFVYECQSYCLRAGTYAPRRGRQGRGYLFAPLQGPQADIVRNVLRRSYMHQDIPQKDIQVLLWAIVSHTKIADMPRPLQVTAARILTEAELFRINGGALGLIPDSLISRAFSSLPPAVRRVYEAEARLRAKLTRGRASYEELERIAVLEGDPDPEEDDKEVPRGRWSFHPDGYFIRYFPHGYDRIRIEINIPDPVVVERDAQGRITLIDDQRGNTIEVEYDENIPPLMVAGEDYLRGFAFRSVRLESFNLMDAENPIEDEWSDQGWVFAGTPAGKGRIREASRRFEDADSCYAECCQLKADQDRLGEGIMALLGEEAPGSLFAGDQDKTAALGQFALALNEIGAASPAGPGDRALQFVALVKAAWRHELQNSVRRYVAAAGRASPTQEKAAAALPDPRWYELADYSSDPGEESGPRVYDFAGVLPGAGSDSTDPGGGAAQPGQRGRQRLAPSPRGDNPCDPEGLKALSESQLPENQHRRISCLLDKMGTPGADMRVLTDWDPIATTRTRATASKIIHGGIGMRDWSEMFQWHCARANDAEDLLNRLATTDNAMKNIINRLNDWYNRQKLTPGQAMIKDWIADQQRNPNSAYSCYAQD